MPTLLDFITHSFLSSQLNLPPHELSATSLCTCLSDSWNTTKVWLMRLSWVSASPSPLPHWTSFQSSSSLVPWGRAGCPVYFPVSFPRGNFLRGGDVWFKSHLCLLSTQPRYLSTISTSSRAPVDISAS